MFHALRLSAAAMAFSLVAATAYAQSASELPRLDGRATLTAPAAESDQSVDRDAVEEVRPQVSAQPVRGSQSTQTTSQQQRSNPEAVRRNAYWRLFGLDSTAGAGGQRPRR